MLANVGFKAFCTQVLTLTHAGLIARYRRTVIGILWVLINPILMFSIQLLVFREILGMPFREYFLFLLSGLIAWLFISQTLDMCVGILVNSASMLRSVTVHPIAYVVAQALDNLLNFVAVFVVLLIPALLMGWVSFWTPLLLIPPMIFLAVATTAAAWLLAILQVFLRDTRFLLSFALSLGYFLTPIFYPLERVPTLWLRKIVQFNPVNGLLWPFRLAVQNANAAQYFLACAIAAGIGLILSGLGAYIWRTRRNDVYLNL